MGSVPPALSFLLMMVAGWVHRQQLIVIDFLQAENRLLKEQLRGKRIRFTDAERALLARKAKAVGRKALLELDTIVSPDTLLRWHQRLVAKKWTVPVQQRASARLPCRRRRPMTKRQDRDAIYVKRQFDTEIIVLCVRWYITYRLSYRDLVAMMTERGVIVSHTTIMRWVIRYVPEFEKRWNRFARPIGSSWRVDETYISIKGRWHYLYRAVDKQGRSVDFMLRPDRGIAAAQAFFRKALASNLDRAPRKVTLDGHVPSHRALRLLRREHPAWRRVRVRSSKYLNNIIEQDHRAIKRRCASMKGFKSFANAAVTIAGVELAHRIHKHQFSLRRGRPCNDRSLRTDWEHAVA